MLSRYSHSSLDTFRQCPQKFWFHYVEKIKLPQRGFAHLELGSIVHLQLATLYRRAADGQVPSKDELIARYEEEWRKLDYSRLEVAAEHMGVDDYIEMGRRMLGAYYNRFQPFNQSLLIMAEQDVNFQLSGSSVNFLARIDRVLKRSDGVLEICDYKTGGQALPSARDASFRQQMGLYQLAIQDRYPQFKEIELVQYALKYEEAVSCRLRPDELDELQEQFRSEVSQIAHAEKIDDWPANEGGRCRFCDYAHLCPKKRHRVVLEDEAESENRTTAIQAAELTDMYIQLHRQKNAADAEMKAIKKELVAAAKDLEVSKLHGSEGHVQVSIKNTEKLPTKTSDAAGLAEVTALIRSWGEDMELCLKLDDRELLELVRKGRLTPERLEQLQPYLMVKEGVTVRVYPKDSGRDED